MELSNVQNVNITIGTIHMNVGKRKAIDEIEIEEKKTKTEEVEKDSPIQYKHKLYVDECPICFEEKELHPLGCAHDLCLRCCIQHFRKSENCPICRRLICARSYTDADLNRLFNIEMVTRYSYDYANNNMNTYELLHSKGINNEDRHDIIESFRDSVFTIVHSLDNYSNVDMDSDNETEDNEDDKTVISNELKESNEIKLDIAEDKMNTE